MAGHVAPVDHRNVLAALRRLALPAAFALAGDQLLGIADTIVIGSFGAAALAAITAASSVFLCLVIPLYAFTAGPRIMGAQAIGAGDLSRFGRIVRASAVTPLVVALAAIGAAILLAHPLMSAMLHGIPESHAAGTYLILRSISLIAIIVSGTAIAAFGAAGDMKLGLRVLIVINLVHLPLLAILALGLGTHHPLAIVGAGISSLLSEVVGAVYALTRVRARSELRILAEAKIDGPLARASFWLGLPEFVFLVVMVVPDPITIALLAPLGVTIVAAYRALSVVNDLMWAFPGSLGDATQIVVGQRLGARDVAGARLFATDAIKAGVIICSVAGLFVAIFAKPLAFLFTLNWTLAAMASGPLAVHMLTSPFKGFAMTSLAPIRAAGDTRFSMWIGIMTGSIGLGVIALGIEVFHLGLWAVPLAWLTAWPARCIATALRLRTGDWEVRRLAA